MPLISGLNVLSDFYVPGGSYTSIFKTTMPLVLLLPWTRLLTWADKDAEDAHLPRVPLNIANMGGLIISYGLFFLLPTFILSFFILLIGFGAEVGVYLQLRKKSVGLRDLRKQWETFKKDLMSRGKKTQSADPLILIAKDGKTIEKPSEESADRPAYDALQSIFMDAIVKGAEQIDVTPSQQGFVCKYSVDGAPYTGATLDPTVAAAALAWVKQAAGADPAELRRPQVGAMKAKFMDRRAELKIQTAGTTAGEYLRVLIDPKKRHEFKIEGLGFTDAQLQTAKEIIKGRKGVVLIAAPKGNGMTTLLYAMVRGHDAFIEHIHSVERDAEESLEGVTQNKLAANATMTDEASSVDWVISQEPDVVMLNRLESPQTAAALAAFANSGKMVYVAMRAGSAAEAVDQWRRLAGDKALEPLGLVIAGRIVRKLCVACKEGYVPEPDTLRRLGMDPAKISQLFKAREQAVRDPKTNKPIPCEFCKDLRFKGRVGIYEMLKVDAETRAALEQDYAKGSKAGSALKAVFRKQRGRYLGETGLALVEAGETSVQEVLRVLRGESQPAAGAAPARAPAAGAAAPVARARTRQ